MAGVAILSLFRDSRWSSLGGTSFRRRWYRPPNGIYHPQGHGHDGGLTWLIPIVRDSWRNALVVTQGGRDGTAESLDGQRPGNCRADQGKRFPDAGNSISKAGKGGIIWDMAELIMEFALSIPPA